jgi:hypothetical protein
LHPVSIAAASSAPPDRPLDTGAVWRENRAVTRSGASRRQIAQTLTIAYGEGLLSEDTFQRRLDEALGVGQIDSIGLVGDLMTRSTVVGLRARLLAVIDRIRRRHAGDRGQPADLLALDWTGSVPELVMGRSHRCDVVLDEPSVSRQHARLVFRDGCWVLQDLQSTNGTTVNGVPVGRCQLQPGDELTLGTACLQVD